MLTFARVAGGLAGVMFVLGGFVLYRLFTKPVPGLPHGLHMPALAMEFIEGTDGVTQFLERKDDATGKPMREKLRADLKGDYVFIGMYLVVFLVLSLMLGRSWTAAAGVVAALLAVGAAGYDVVENVRVAALLDAPQVTEGLVAGVSAACHAKWFFFALTTLALSSLFMRPSWLGVLAALYAAVGLLCLLGLRTSPRFVEVAFLLTFIGMAPLAYALIFTPGKLLAAD